MNQTPEKGTRVLEVLLDGHHQGNIHLYISSKLIISKINFEKHEEFLKKAQNKTQMLNQNTSYQGFDFGTYTNALKHSLRRIFPEQEIEIKNKYLGRYQGLLDKKNRLRYTHQ